MSTESTIPESTTRRGFWHAHGCGRGNRKRVAPRKRDFACAAEEKGTKHAIRLGGPVFGARKTPRGWPWPIASWAIGPPIVRRLIERQRADSRHRRPRLPSTT